LEPEGMIEPVGERVGLDGKVQSALQAPKIGSSGFTNVQPEETSPVINPYDTWFSDHVKVASPRTWESRVLLL